MTEDAENSTLEPSRFWDQLGAEHRQQLVDFGFDHVKRHQALRYFTWNWRWAHIRSSEQFRFLLAHTSPRVCVAAARESMDLSDEAWAGVPWSRADRRLYCFATRILWEYARRRGAEQVLELPEPLVGDPLPVRWRGRLISQDLANSALETEAILRALDGRAPEHILEVGAGYGRTAYALLGIFPEARYTIIDIEPASEIARWYLGEVCPGRSVAFLGPADAAGIADAQVDLAVSISSLQEMTHEQVRTYLRLFDRVAAGGTVFLKQWRTWRNPVDEIELRFDQYPVPERWVRRFEEPAPVQTRFVQAAWDVARSGGDS
jgi:putative sugar O-methyltransferase